MQHHHDQKIARLAQRSRLLAEKHAKEQVAHWRPQIHHHILSINSEMARAFIKSITELHRSLISMEETIKNHLDEATSREVCEAIPSKEQLVAKAYRACGFHLEKEFGVSLVPASRGSTAPPDASVITIPSDDEEDVSSSQTFDEETNNEDEIRPQPNKKRPQPTSPDITPKRRRRRYSISDTVSESSYHPSPEPESQSQTLQMAVCTSSATGILTRSHISSTTSISSSSHPTPSPTPEPTSSRKKGQFKIPNLRKYGWPLTDTSDRPIEGLQQHPNRSDIRSAGNMNVPIADMA
ncbi:hypothetical protein QBC38DRAFT_470209 [Podospora fimiseda]|uniref:Uncharacterized protein n=1 Tax=Podospora fimiseda TaxID=252190 RepID=A0AAN7BVH1_9PEZI|nr:hypothetical protein QBC38DRAFT_470209 [Podospora fimiseda]